MTTVNHAANAASVDEGLPPATLPISGNPSVGTPLLQATRSVATDLPRKVLVREDDARAKVTYSDSRHLARRHGIDGQAERLGRVASVLDSPATGEG